MDVNLVFLSNASGTLESATGTVSLDPVIIGFGFLLFCIGFFLLVFILKHD